MHNPFPLQNVTFWYMQPRSLISLFLALCGKWSALNFFKRTALALIRLYGRTGWSTLRKHAYSNILKILPPKNENFQIKNSDIFQISAQNIDCGYSLEPPRRGGSNEYPQSMFLGRNKKKLYTPVNPSFTILNWGIRGSKLYRHVFVMNSSLGAQIQRYTFSCWGSFTLH